jgi:type IV secretion system protein VirB10
MNRPDQPQGDANAIAPLEGEAGIPNVAEARVGSVSWKGISAVALLVVSLVAVSGMAVHRMLSSDDKDPAANKRNADRPTAAANQPRRLEMPPMSEVKASAPDGPKIPAITPNDEERAEPIGVHRTGAAGPTGGRNTPVRPEDAPVMLVTARAGTQAPTPAAPGDPAESGMPGHYDQLVGAQRNLQGYQHQLQGLMDSLTKTSKLATGGGGLTLPAAAADPGLAGRTASPGLFGGQLQGSTTPRVSASMLGDRSLIVPKGTAFTCALKTKVISAVSGMVGCQVQRNVYSDDGRVLLIERGSHLDGEYRIASVRPGMVRIPVLWTRIRTPLGLTVDIDSPGTGPLGESGIDGYVDNRWTERIGAAMLLSLIDDAVQINLRSETNTGGANTVLLPSTTANTSKLAEKVLDSTINIPPLIYQNQGGIVGIYVAHDLDFSSVYELKPTALSPSRGAEP